VESLQQGKTRVIECGAFYDPPLLTMENENNRKRNDPRHSGNSMTNVSNVDSDAVGELLFECPAQGCDKAFSTKSGRGLHMKSAHNELFNDNIARERKRPIWDDEERDLVIATEVQILREYPNVRFINMELKERLNTDRSLESIRCLRKSADYKSKLAKALAENNIVTEEPVPVDDPQEREASLQEIRDYLRTLVEGKQPKEAFREADLNAIVSEALNGQNVEKRVMEYLQCVLEKKPLPPHGGGGLAGYLANSSVEDRDRRKTQGYVGPTTQSPVPNRVRTRARARAEPVPTPELPRGFPTDNSSMSDLVKRRIRRQALSRAEGLSLARELQSIPVPHGDQKVSQVGNKAKNQKRQIKPKALQRVMLYRKTQEMYKNNRSRLARDILDGKKLDAKPDYLKGVAQAWAASFSEPSVGVDSSIMRNKEPYDVTVWHPIKYDELDDLLKTLDRNSAKGPDGFSVALVKSIPRVVLLKILNLFLLTGKLPEKLKTSRTILIPKKDHPKDSSEFRPISISPVLVRLFHKCLAKRITLAADLDIRQRGFLPVDGCAENIMILESAIRETQNQKRSAFLVSLDIKNAFGSVAHEAIIRALQCSGAPGLLVDYVRDLYTNFITQIVYGKERILTVVRRGVLQGDPLSPILFNLVIDQVLMRLPDPVGIQLSKDTRANSMAFADDMTLMASTEVGIRSLLSSVEGTANKFGLIFHPGKCVYLALAWVGKEKKIKVLTDLDLEIGGGCMKATKVTEMWRYLGAFFGPWGIQRVDTSLVAFLDRLKKAKLKPQQKLFVLRMHLIPRLIHNLVMTPVKVGLYNKLDKLIRGALTGKNGILHIPASVPSCYFYAPVSHGGLGLMEFRTSIPALILRRFERMSFSDSPLVRAAANNVANCNRVRLAKRHIRKQADGTDVTTRTGVQKYHAERLHASWDGMKLEEAPRVKIHSWVADGTRTMSGQAFCEALNIRINALPTLARFHRGQKNVRKSCRAGCKEIESLHHVLQVCPRTHDIRCSRHNRVSKKLASFLKQKGHKVYEEPLINTPSGLRKPDIICVRDEHAVVLDVQVSDMDLNRAHYQKIKYYKNEDSISDYTRNLGCKTVSFSACVISPQAIFSSKSAKDLVGLGLSLAMLRTLAIIAIEQSTYIWHLFNRSAAHSWVRRKRKSPN